MDELELQKQKKEIARTEHIETLKTFQTWGPAQGPELQLQKQVFAADIMKYQTEYDEAMIARMQEQLPHVQVNAVAAVPHPPVQQLAAKEGYKARREREKKRKAAQKICPVGDEYTLDIASEIQRDIHCRDLSLTKDMFPECEESHSDMRALKVFCQSFKLDKKGQPATDEDEAVLLQNKQFVHDYATGDAALRKPHLDRITDDIMKISFAMTPDMFTPELITKNAAKYKQMGDMFTYFENIQKENPAYFAALPQVQKDFISQQLTVAVQFTGAFTQHMNARGINFNFGTVYSNEEAPVIEMGLNGAEIMTQGYKDALAQANVDVGGAYGREVDRQTEANKAALIQANTELDQEYTTEYGVSFTSGATSLQYEDMKKYRSMIADNPEAYSQNKELVDSLFADLYKVLSQIGEQTVEMRARQQVIDDITEERTHDKLKLRVQRTASDKNETHMNNMGKIQNYGMSIMDALRHLLRGTKIPDVSTALLERYRNSAPEHPVNGADGAEV